MDNHEQTIQLISQSNNAYIREKFNSVHRINDELNHIQPWLWWEDHAVLRNTLLILSTFIITMALLTIITLIINGILKLIKFKSQHNLKWSVGTIIGLSLIGTGIMVGYLVILQTNHTHIDVYQHRYINPHAYQKDLNIRKMELESQL